MDRASSTATAAGRVARPAGRPWPWLLPAGLLLVLAVLTVNVLVHGPLVAMDQHIRQTVQGWAYSAAWRWLGDSPRAPAQLVTDLGRETLAVPVLAVIAAVLAVRRRTLRPLLVAAAGVALLLVTVIPAKIIIARPGPGASGVAPGNLGYFPSGHTTTSCVCYSIAVLLLIAGRAATMRRAALAGLAAVWLLVGMALVSCDYHWATDVLAGWALAGLIVWLAVRVPVPHRPPRAPR
ncbi:MAG TPA: phosphatase PAP2 family protein [Streptosporangiaceae bacterium]|nr:phosphatase PAP2 family protein [Streptosporangiaceae bacterium]